MLSRLEMTGEELRARIAEYQTNVFKAATAAFKQLVSGIFNTIVCFFTLYFLYVDGKTAAGQALRALHRIGGTRFRVIAERMKETVRAAVYGVLVTAVVQGVLAGIGYAVVRTPVPVFLGFLTMLSSLIPIGTPIVFLPVAAYLAATGSAMAAVFVVVWGTVVVGLVDNLLRPFFISRTTRMPIVFSFFAVLGGIFAFGVIGVVVGPAILAAAQALWLEWVNVEKIEPQEELTPVI